MSDTLIRVFATLCGGALIAGPIYAILKYNPAPFRNLYYVAFGVLLIAVASDTPFDLQLSPSEGLRARTNIIVESTSAGDESLAFLPTASSDPDGPASSDPGGPPHLADITFGQPLIYTASEKNLLIPSTILDEFDVYWIEFAITLRGNDLDLINDISLNVALEEGYVALALFPDNYTKSIDSGPIRAINREKLPGTSVYLGDVFGQSIFYSYIRPKILSFGLKERAFGWKLSGLAIHAGSQKFVAVVAAPKQAEAITIGLSARAHLGRTIFGTPESSTTQDLRP